MKISVAIPESSLSDESLKSAKTRKASVIARMCAIFGVDTIYVYGEKDRASRLRKGRAPKDGRVGGSRYARSDAELLVTVLRYMEAPQFLRKRLFSRTDELKFAGMVLPLRIPSHTTSKNPAKGEVREGVVVPAKGGRLIDIGTGKLIPYTGRTEPGKRITIRIRETEPRITYTEIEREQIGQYWGYAVKHRASLRSLLSEWKGQTIVTSRKGRPAYGRGSHTGSGGMAGQQRDPARYAILRDQSDALVVFGSPERGVHEMLGGGVGAMSGARVLDFFPGQQTSTVRLEEAIMGVLSIINMEACARSPRPAPRQDGAA